MKQMTLEDARDFTNDLFKATKWRIDQEFLVADIITCVIRFAAVSAFSGMGEVEAMELIREAVQDAAVYKRNYDTQHKA